MRTNDKTMKMMAIAVGLCIAVVLTVHRAEDEQEAVLASAVVRGIQPMLVLYVACAGAKIVAHGLTLACAVKRLYDHMMIITMSSQWFGKVEEPVQIRCRKVSNCRCGSDNQGGP